MDLSGCITTASVVLSFSWWQQEHLLLHHHHSGICVVFACNVYLNMLIFIRSVSLRCAGWESTFRAQVENCFLKWVRGVSVFCHELLVCLLSVPWLHMLNVKPYINHWTHCSLYSPSAGNCRRVCGSNFLCNEGFKMFEQDTLGSLSKPCPTWVKMKPSVPPPHTNGLLSD